VREYAQRRVDVIDLEANHLVSASFQEIVRRSPGVPLEIFASRDLKAEKAMASRGTGGVFSWVLTFDRLMSKTDFVSDMRELLRILQDAYNYPVDVEFTLNFFEQDKYRISVVQCRPLQVCSAEPSVDPPSDLSEEHVILRAQGAVVGKSVHSSLDWIVYVVPREYSQLSEPQRYAVARLIGDLTSLQEVQSGTIMLVGPGRWGTTTPSLGVPVAFVAIQAVSVLCELEVMHDALVPDASLGTHFFNELVENDMVYLALFPGREGNWLNTDVLEDDRLNRLGELLPEQADLGNVLRILRARDVAGGSPFVFNANVMNQSAVCYRESLPTED